MIGADGGTGIGALVGERESSGRGRRVVTAFGVPPRFEQPGFAVEIGAPPATTPTTRGVYTSVYTP